MCPTDTLTIFYGAELLFGEGHFAIHSCPIELPHKVVSEDLFEGPWGEYRIHRHNKVSTDEYS